MCASGQQFPQGGMVGYINGWIERYCIGLALSHTDTLAEQNRAVSRAAFVAQGSDHRESIEQMEACVDDTTLA